MARELGLSPHSLTKNIPSPSERWKAPVEDWVRGLHLKKFGARAPHRTPPPAVAPASAPPPIAAAPFDELTAAQDELLDRMQHGEIEPEFASAEMDRLERETPVSSGEIEHENQRMLRRRDCFRRFADLFAAVAAKLDFVQRVVLFGSVAAPLQKEVPRFSRLRRERVAVWHECKDVDLALWVSDLTRLRELKRAVADTTNQWQAIAALETLPGIPHHQVDVFILEPATDRYRGNLCHYGQCPKGKPECAVAGCGAQPFLRLYDDFQFDRFAPLRAPAVVLFDRISRDAKS